MFSNKISIIIPAYNEEKTVARLLEKVIFESRQWDAQIIVVNDGSKDKTLEEAKKFSDSIILVNLSENRGKGRAIQEGLKKATGDIVILQDADLELDPKDYKNLLTPILEGKSQVVYGSRILGGDINKGSLFFWGGQLMTLLANVLYGLKITDQTNGYKIMPRKLLNDMNLKSQGFEVCSEVTAKIAKRGLAIHEVPVSYFPRSSQEGKKLKVRHGLKAAWALLKYKFID